MSVAFRNVEVEGRRTNVLTDGHRIGAIGPIDRWRPETIIDGNGGALLPGLHDHHLHLLALAASLASVPVARADVGDRPGMVAALRQSADARPPGTWLRAVGYHERVAGDLDRWALDGMVGDRPVRVQHRSGALWVLNSCALHQLGLLDGGAPDGVERGDDGVPTGRLWRLDRWLGRRLPSEPPDLATTGRLLMRQGITGVTDATPFATPTELAPLVAASTNGALPLRLTITGAPSLDVDALPPDVGVGPAKVLLHDHDLPTLDELVAQLQVARAHGRAVAVHCVTRVALVLTLTALDVVGARIGDRIEHGAVVPPELHDSLRRLGITVVTQPNFVAERGDDYLADVEPADLDHLWPCASLLTAGVPVGGGTDAPFGRPDVWALVAAATTRRTPAGAVVGEPEQVSATRALDLLLTPWDRPGGPPRRVEVGSPADLCLLRHPLARALEGLPANPVRATMVAGSLYEVDGPPTSPS